MKKLYIIGILFVLALLLHISSNGAEQGNQIYNYFGQKPPGMIPEVFAPGIVSTEEDELNCMFSPAGDELFFTIVRSEINTIYTIKFNKDGTWSEKKVAPFSGKYSDVDPYCSLDGKRLYFASMRPIDGSGKPKDSDLWYIEKDASGKWNNPVRIESCSTQGKHDFYISVSNKNNLYFSIFETGYKGGDLYVVHIKDGEFSKPEKLKFPINTEHNEHDPFIAPDESYLIFTSNRPRGCGSSDLYISFRLSDSTWSDPVNMGCVINTAGYDFCPMLSPDGEYFFLTRTTNGIGDVYWVDARVIEKIKKEVMDKQKKD